ncbi:MAG TPA: glycerophosphodiester phosphodiesterase [Gemmatimonadales bacterium]
MPHPPWIIGHRGVPTRRAENSLDGFALAIELGADGIELDVHATRDGVVVVHHDPALRDGRAIAAHGLAELQRHRGASELLPTLADVLSLALGRAAVFVEIKGRDIEALVVAEVLRSAARCAIHSFDHRAIRRVRELAPSLPTGILQSSRLVRTSDAMHAAGAGTLWQSGDLVDRDLVDEVHAVGGSVIAWTVNDASAMRRLAALGVSGICTDDVELARSVLRDG